MLICGWVEECIYGGELENGREYLTLSWPDYSVLQFPLLWNVYELVYTH